RVSRRRNRSHGPGSARTADAPSAPRWAPPATSRMNRLWCCCATACTGPPACLVPARRPPDGSTTGRRLLQKRSQALGDDAILAFLKDEDGDEDALVAGAADAADQDRRVASRQVARQALAGRLHALLIPRQDQVGDVICDRRHDALALERRYVL